MAISGYLPLFQAIAGSLCSTLVTWELMFQTILGCLRLSQAILDYLGPYMEKGADAQTLSAEAFEN